MITHAYMAPMDEITTYVFRNAHHRFYAPMDKYFTPFLSPADFGPIFDPKEMSEIDPVNNQGLCVVPQLMVGRSDVCLTALDLLRQIGYQEVNLNMGCPSGIVVKKRKGCGMLRDPAALNHFLDDVFTSLPTGMHLSVKTRLGMQDPAEFTALIEVFKHYPIHELILHPRVRTQFYRGMIHKASYRRAAESLPYPTIYNGELRRTEDLAALEAEFPSVSCVMLGRGLIEHPGIWTAYQSKDFMSTDPSPEDFSTFLAFHDALVQGYCELLPRESSVVVKMKKLWACWKNIFPQNQEAIRRILQTNSLDEYREMTQQIWRDDL